MPIHFHENRVDLIKRACAKATRGVICTPYYSERGLNLLDSFFDTAERVEFWTRFSPLDWRAGVADMSALKRRIQLVLDRGKTFDFRVSDDLHAKIYTFSDNVVIIGSANLTWPAMTSNIEVICELTENDATSFFSVLSTLRRKLIPVPAEVFAAYVDVAADAISKPFDGLLEEDGEMNAAINLAEETLGNSLKQTTSKLPSRVTLEIENFFDYCREEKSDIAKEIIDRGLKDKHNLQGHVKHCFYGALWFLSEFPQYVAEISKTPVDSLYEFTNQSVQTNWRDFLREHASEIDEEHRFRFRTLRVYLPPSLGGICSGGGGGSGTLKRVLPVVARMIQESGNRDG